MELEKYRPYWTKDYLMGPNSLRVLQELLEKNPCPLNADSLILDLGCGTGLTSFALCMETGAKVLANDLWISGERTQPGLPHGALATESPRCMKTRTTFVLRRKALMPLSALIPTTILRERRLFPAEDSAVSETRRCGAVWRSRNP